MRKADPEPARLKTRGPAQDLPYGEAGVLGLARTWPQAACALPGAGAPFDWQGDRPLGLPMEDLIIYEMHVRGFTAHLGPQQNLRVAWAGLPRPRRGGRAVAGCAPRTRAPALRHALAAAWPAAPPGAIRGRGGQTSCLQQVGLKRWPRRLRRADARQRAAALHDRAKVPALR